MDIDSENDFEIMELLGKYYWECGRYLDINNRCLNIEFYESIGIDCTLVVHGGY